MIASRIAPVAEVKASETANLAISIKKSVLPPFSFLIPTAKNTDYAFIKELSKHFSDDAVLKKDVTPGKENTVSMRKKRAKTKPSKNIHSKRDSFNWVFVDYQNSHKQSKDETRRMAALIVDCAETCRFGMGDTSPKYRVLYKEREDNYSTTSKQINFDVDFFEYATDDHSDLTSLKDVGRGVFYSFALLNDDFNNGNAFVTKDRRFVIYDFDFCFPELSYQLRQNKYVDKYTRTYYPPSIEQAKRQGDTEENRQWILNGSKQPRRIDDMVDLTACDMANLPELHHMVARNWMFNDFVPLDNDYIQQGAPEKCHLPKIKTQRFYNETYFSALSYLVMAHVHLAFTDVHAVLAEDKRIVKAMKERRIQAINMQFIQLPKYANYLKTNKLNAMLVIFFEANQFFQNNGHYLPTDKADEKRQWNLLIQHAIANFSGLLKKMGIELTAAELIQLNQYAIDIKENKLEVIKQIEEYYLAQEMNLRAKDVRALYNHLALTEAIAASVQQSKTAGGSTVIMMKGMNMTPATITSAPAQVQPSEIAKPVALPTQKKEPVSVKPDFPNGWIFSP